ncbi:hypothetical protein ACTOXX_34900 [Streptomyces rubiginosohelvolus]|uniref:hypothetical protein n=1 Tax=Streptomyces rubiginosohelvolus TaxID=67362 RepID=UPI003F8F9CAB
MAVRRRPPTAFTFTTAPSANTPPPAGGTSRPSCCVTRGQASGVVPDAVSDALDEVSTTDASLLPTALRILGALRAGPAAVPATVGAVIDYAPAAVGYVDDFDFPLADPDFAGHIRTLIATDATDPWKTGGGCKRATRVGSFVEVFWGRDGHTGPKCPRNTKVCAEFRGLPTKACVTFK